MAVGEKERLIKLERQSKTGVTGQVLEVPFVEAENIIEDDPLEQLPGEGDDWYSRFMHFIHCGGANITVVNWHRKYNTKNCSEVHTSHMARMFLWRRRRVIHQRMLVQEVGIAAKRQIYDSHVNQMRIIDEWVPKLLELSMAEESEAKSASFLRTAQQMQANGMRNQAENQKHWSRFDAEMAKIRAMRETSGEDLD